MAIMLEVRPGVGSTFNYMRTLCSKIFEAATNGEVQNLTATFSKQLQENEVQLRI